MDLPIKPSCWITVNGILEAEGPGAPPAGYMTGVAKRLSRYTDYTNGDLYIQMSSDVANPNWQVQILQGNVS